MYKGRKSKLQTIKAFAMATAAAVSFTAATTSDGRAFQDEGTIILCSIEPLSGIGTSFGQPNYLGKVIAVEEINAEGGDDDGRDADGGGLGRDDHERGAIEAWLERRGEIGAGDVEEIAPGLCERAEEGALGFGERKVDRVGKG